KHFTLCRAAGGVDAAFSLEPHELRSLVEESARAWTALGEVRYVPSEKERTQMIFKRSIYADRDLEAGHVLEPGDVRVIRPALGLNPRHFHAVHGRTLQQPIRRGEPLTGRHVAL